LLCAKICRRSLPVDYEGVLRDLFQSTVSSPYLNIPDFTANTDQMVLIFTTVWRNGLNMESIEIDYSHTCQELVNSDAWRVADLPSVAAAPDKNWLQLAKTLVEVGRFGSECNDFSRIMFIGRGMAGKSRLLSFIWRNQTRQAYHWFRAAVPSAYS
jgi:hypothetical protein